MRKKETKPRAKRSKVEKEVIDLAKTMKPIEALDALFTAADDEDEILNMDEIIDSQDMGSIGTIENRDKQSHFEDFSVLDAIEPTEPYNPNDFVEEDVRQVEFEKSPVYVLTKADKVAEFFNNTLKDASPDIEKMADYFASVYLGNDWLDDEFDVFSLKFRYFISSHNIETLPLTYKQLGRFHKIYGNYDIQQIRRELGISYDPTKS